MTPFDVLKTRLQTVPPHLHPSAVSPSLPPFASAAISQGSASAAAAAAADCCQTTYSGVSGTSMKPEHPLVCTHSSSVSVPSTKNGIDISSIRPSPSPSPSLSSGTSTSTRTGVNALRPPSGCLNPSKWAGIWGEPIPSSVPGGGGGGAGVLVLREGPGVALGSLHLSGAGAGGGSSNIGVKSLLSSMKSSTGAVSGAIGSTGTGTGGFWKEVATVRAESGIRGLWKGVGTAMYVFFFFFSKTMIHGSTFCDFFFPEQWVYLPRRYTCSAMNIYLLSSHLISSILPSPSTPPRRQHRRLPYQDPNRLTIR